MLEVVSYKMLKTMENSDKAVILKSGCGRLQEVDIYERFQLKGFEWGNFSVFTRWSHMDVRRNFQSRFSSY